MTPADNEWEKDLETMLRQPSPYLNDEGFTATVVSRLPPRRSSTWRRYAILGLFTGFAGVAALLLPVGAFLPETFRQAATWPHSASMIPLASWAVVALIVWAGLGIASAEDA